MYGMCHNPELSPKHCSKDNFSVLSREKVNIVDYSTDSAEDLTMFGEAKLLKKMSFVFYLFYLFVCAWDTGIQKHT